MMTTSKMPGTARVIVKKPYGSMTFSHWMVYDVRYNGPRKCFAQIRNLNQSAMKECVSLVVSRLALNLFEGDYMLIEPQGCATFVDKDCVINRLGAIINPITQTTIKDFKEAEEVAKPKIEPIPKAEPVPDPDPVDIDLPHCGKFHITKGNIEGAFKPIPLDLWAAIVGFHRAVSLKWQAESVSYHHWDETEQRYHSLIPYQNTSAGGLSINLSWTDKRNVALLDSYGEKYGREFLPACTIHTHVNAAAFESGTDANDEAFQPGWHITLGKLIYAQSYDIHARMRLPRVPSVNALVNTHVAYRIDPKHLFSKETDVAALMKIPGTTDWHHLLERINAR